MTTHVDERRMLLRIQTTEFRSRWRQFWQRLNPAQLFVGSFAALILAGTAGFMVLPGLYTGPSLSFLDALFTATSAVCVTGLIVVDTATYFTFWGQLYILLLIQIGGLGIIAFTSVILISLGLRLSLRQERLSRTPAEIAPEVDYQRLTVDIFLFTFSIEAFGAVILYASMAPVIGWDAAVWHSIFHAISAFCNAGFSTFPDSMMSFVRHPAVLSVVMVLIVAGGIGFLTLEEISLRWRSRQSRRPLRLSIHTKLVLTVTAVLIVGGWILLTLFEWEVTLGNLAPFHKIVNGLFASITARTAGFNTIEYGDATNGTNFLTILLMSIGGSPGSTAGGLKTTTAALIGLVAWSRLRGYDLVHVWGRSIPEATVQRSIGLFVIVFGIVTAAIFLFAAKEIEWLSHTEVGGSFLQHMFEAVSAFNTVGLSMGVTDALSGTGKVSTIILMLVGRVGVLTFAAALARRHARAAGRYRFAYEDVAIG